MTFVSKNKQFERRTFLFNETFYLRLYGARQMVKGHSDSERKPVAIT